MNVQCAPLSEAFARAPHFALEGGLPSRPEPEVIDLVSDSECDSDDDEELACATLLLPSARSAAQQSMVETWEGDVARARACQAEQLQRELRRLPSTRVRAPPSPVTRPTESLSSESEEAAAPDTWNHEAGDALRQAMDDAIAERDAFEAARALRLENRSPLPSLHGTAFDPDHAYHMEEEGFDFEFEDIDLEFNEPGDACWIDMLQ